MKNNRTDREGDQLEGRFAQFDRRLKAILGEGRIPRREKRAKAEQAVQAVDDLVEDIASDLGRIEGSD